jgi:hypothetical protein
MLVLALYGTLNPLPEGHARVGIWMALAVAVTTGLRTLYLRRNRPAVFERAAGHVLEPEDFEGFAPASEAPR